MVPKHGCWLCSGAGEVSLAGGDICLYSLNFTKQGRVGRTAGQELHCDTNWQPQGVSWGVDGMNLKRKEKISSLLCACSSLACLCAQCPTLLFCYIPFFLQGFERTWFPQL